MRTGHQGIDICLRVAMIKEYYGLRNLVARIRFHADTAAFRIKFHVISGFNAQVPLHPPQTAPLSDPVLSCAPI